MLRLEDALRVEEDFVQDGRGGYRRPIYVFGCTSCGKEMRKQKGALKTHTGLCVQCVKRVRHPYQTLYNTAKASCIRENNRSGRRCPFELTFEEFCYLTDIRMCAYCGGTVDWHEYKAGPSNLDRKDSARGYTVDNVVVCCGSCNWVKGAHYSFDEFVAVMTLIRIMRAGDADTNSQLIFDLHSLRAQMQLAEEKA